MNWAFVCLLVSALGLGIEVHLLSQSSSSIVVEIDARDLGLSEFKSEGFWQTRITGKNLEWERGTGTPLVPFFRFQVYLPQGRDPELEVRAVSTEGKFLHHDIEFNSQEAIHSADRKHFQKSKEAYSRSYEPTVAKITEVGYAGSDRIATIQINPVRYDALNRKIIFSRKLRLELKFGGNRSKSPISQVNLARYLTINPPTIREPYANKIDLIIAYDDHKGALARYLSFKRMQGRQVREFYVKGKSADEIRAMIKKEFQQTPSPNGVFLVGNIDQIPSFRGSSDNTWSDFRYQDLTDDGIPDVAVGRVPAMNSTELQNFVDKAIQRELDQPKVGDILLTAGQDTSLGCPDSVTKVGRNILAAGDDISIIKKYRTEVGTTEVIEAYNDNPNVVVYDGHGNRTSMAEIPLYLSQLSVLKNNIYPIVLDIACLNANWTSSGATARNFAETTLLMSGGGAAGIMASGGSGYGHDFFQTIGTMMAEARRALNTNPQLNEVGHVILLAKIKHGTQDRTYWNYYGDPASSVWESVRTGFKISFESSVEGYRGIFTN